MTAGYNPDFDIDMPYGVDVEPLIRQIFTAARDGHVLVEVKHKRRQDNMFYIESEHDPGRTGRYRASGLALTKSDHMALVVADTGVVVVVPTGRVRRAILRGLGRPAEEKDGSCPTKGRLLSFDQLIATILNA